MRCCSFVLRNLGRLYASEGRVHEARGCLREGEHLVRQTRDAGHLATLLCYRASLEWEAGDHRAARDALAEARDLADRVGATPDTSLGQALAEARAVVEGS